MQIIKERHHMKFTRLAVRFAIMTILCSTTAEAKGTCPVGGCPPPPPPLVVIPTAVTTCACANEAALYAAANSYLSKWILLTPPGYTGVAVISALGYPTIGGPGTEVVVVSTSVPISGIYYFRWSGGTFSLNSVNPRTDTAAVANDEVLLARSVKMTPITLLPGQTIQGVDIPEDINGWLQGRLVQTDGGTSFWHAMLTLNFPQVVWATFRDPVTGQSFTVYSGEIITIFDASGWSVQVQYNLGVASVPWQIVPGSVRDNHGNKVNMVNNVPITPIPGTGSLVLGAALTVSGGVTWNPVKIIPWQDNTPTGTVTVGDPIQESGGGNRESVPIDD